MGEKRRIRGPFHVHKITFKMICLLNIKKIQMDHKGSTSDLHEKHLVQSIQSFISHEATCSKWKKYAKTCVVYVYSDYVYINIFRLNLADLFKTILKSDPYFYCFLKNPTISVIKTQFNLMCILLHLNESFNDSHLKCECFKMRFI